MVIADSQISVRDHDRGTRCIFLPEKPLVVQAPITLPQRVEAPHHTHKATHARWYLARQCTETGHVLANPTVVLVGLDTKLKMRAEIGTLETETEKETPKPWVTWPQNSQ